MKKQSQAAKTSNIIPPKSQDQTQPASEPFTVPPELYAKVCGALLMSNNGRPTNISPDDVIVRAIQAEINRMHAPSGALGNLEDAVHESISLINLMVTMIKNAAAKTCGPDEDFATSVTVLAHLASRRLSASFETAHSYATGRGPLFPDAHLSLLY